MELNLNLDDFIGNEIPVNNENYENLTKLHPRELKSKDQTRKNFGKNELVELADSIKEHGLLQPIIISDKQDEDGKYTIIAGERRWRACALIDIEINCIKRKDTENYRTIQIIENLQRKDLTLIEECEAIKQLQTEKQFNVQELAKAIKKDESWVSRRLKIANAEDEFKALLIKNKIESVTTADDLEKVFKIKPKTAQRLIEQKANRNEIKKKLKSLKNGINTRVKEKKPKTKTPILEYSGLTIELISDAQAIDQSGNIIDIQINNVSIVGVK